MSAPTKIRSLAQVVRTARQAAGFSFERLSKRTGVHKAVLVDIEQHRSRRPRADFLVAIAEALELDVRQLYRLAGYPDLADLPDWPVYLRAKYDLPDEALRHLRDQFEFVRHRYGVTPKDDQAPR